MMRNAQQDQDVGSQNE